MNYHDLATEIRKVHKVSTRIVPLVVGALGVLPAELRERVKSLGIENVKGIVNCMQVSAVIGSAIILNKVLNT